MMHFMLPQIDAHKCYYCHFALSCTVTVSAKYTHLRPCTNKQEKGKQKEPTLFSFINTLCGR